jgi:hypothetical protein
VPLVRYHGLVELAYRFIGLIFGFLAWSIFEVGLWLPRRRPSPVISSTKKATIHTLGKFPQEFPVHLI